MRTRRISRLEDAMSDDIRREAGLACVKYEQWADDRDAEEEARRRRREE